MTTKTVLITGCSTGVGYESAKVFLAEGWNVVATMRSPERSKLDAAPRLLVTRLDVQDQGSITAAVAAANERFGGIDVLLNNAGYSMLGVFEEIPRANIQEQFDVNVFGVMDVTRAVLPIMRRQRSGVIVNVSSGSGLFTTPMLSAYHASKFALEGFTESLAYELLPIGITPKLVEPGALLHTDFSTRAMSAAAGNRTIGDYDLFKSAMNAMFAGVMESKNVPGAASTEDVARVAFHAATDGTPRLRYPVGQDIATFLKARQETSEGEYLALMRETFSA